MYDLLQKLCRSPESDFIPNSGDDDRNTDDHSDDDAQKHNIGGKDYTEDEISKGMMLNSDYTQKTQQLAEDRKTFDTDKAAWDKEKGANSDDDDDKTPAEEKRMARIEERLDKADIRDEVEREILKVENDTTVIGNSTRGNILLDNQEAIAKIVNDEKKGIGAATDAWITRNFDSLAGDLSADAVAKEKARQHRNANAATDDSNKSGGRLNDGNDKAPHEGEQYHDFIMRRHKK